MRSVFIGALAMVLATVSATAADVRVEPLPQSGTSIVRLTGDIRPEDAAKFDNAVRNLPDPVIVLFDSLGGSLEAGISIGRTVKRAGYATGVTGTCASACALAWLAGSKLAATPSARIGFHVAYEGASLGNVSGMGNALVGLYLAELGYSENVVRYATLAAPSEMQWLTARDAMLLGLAIIKLADLGVPFQATQTAVETDAGPSLSVEASAIFLLHLYQDFWSLDNEAALRQIRTLYGDRIDYYGNSRSVENVMEDKRAFARRWPRRFYEVQRGSTTAVCVGNECRVSGAVAWHARSDERNRNSTGVADVELVVNTERMEILSEQSAVRKGSKPDPTGLLSRWTALNDECRGGSGDDARTLAACEEREAISNGLAANDFCYGRNGEAGYQHRWHQCDHNSIR